MKKNLFIAFEGIDGSGKSTQVKLLAEKMQQEGFKVFTTCEPTDGVIGSVIRSIMKGKEEADHRTIAALFVADRLDHLLNKTNGILKKLEEGYSVITDRYYFSSYAYQSAHVPMDWVISANSICADILKPDLNIFIDVSPDASMSRISNGRASRELYETADNLKQVRGKYEEAFQLQDSKENIFITNGDRPVGSVAADIWTEVSRIAASVKAN